MGWNPRAGGGGENSLSRVPTGQGFIFLSREGVAAASMRAVGPLAGSGQGPVWKGPSEDSGET